MKQQFHPRDLGHKREPGIFVFGSNHERRSCRRIARAAVEKFGAFMGQAESIQGHIRFIRYNPNNPYREDDINNAYKAIEEMEKLEQKIYPDRSGFLKDEEK